MHHLGWERGYEKGNRGSWLLWKTSFGDGDYAICRNKIPASPLSKSGPGTWKWTQDGPRRQ
ncbi:hypothetical protein I7I53_01484 [Histoplasma capsulatum var. duboisii H88]|uniref:Uncharacterized protein n=1 Tax=Ajellomyces capsulatus (strain H88) TaxID=544711 RepID=A0A8A1LN57_AJEC8|nr:hypothetical protein I7I53_01484 [Histoplasma capsulatum var. duboisii H88]